MKMKRAKKYKTTEIRTNASPVPASPLSEFWDFLDEITKGSSFRKNVEFWMAALGLSPGIKKSSPLSGIAGPDPDFLALIQPIFDFLYSVYFRVKSTGMEHLPKNGPCILIANHAGALPYDGVMINMALAHHTGGRRFVRYLVEDFVFSTPLLGRLVQKCGGVRACHENAMALLDQGEFIVIFPEGVKGVGKSYDERYRLKHFGRGGFVRLAMRTGVPIIPVSVIGSEEIHPIIWKSKKLAEPLGLPFIPFTPTFPWLGPFGLLPLPSKWSITFGRPVSFKGFSAEDADDKALVERLSERVRMTVQRMILAGLKKRRSIWI